MSHQPPASVAEMEAFLDRVFPQIHAGGRFISVERAGEGACTLRHRIEDRHLQPGAVVSGPTMMMLADVALYVALVGAIGPVTDAVTTNLSVNFLNRSGRQDLIADCRYLRIGGRMATGEVTIAAAGSDAPVAHVTGTYVFSRGNQGKA